MSSAAVLSKPRRVVQKAFDGTAAVNAFVLQQAVGAGIAKKIEVATYLLNEGLCPSDVHKMLGMPMNNVRMLGHNDWKGVRVGRTPVSVGSIFLNPARHLRASVFLGFVERIAAVSHEEMISGETFAAALKATNAICGDFAADEVQARYLVLAVLEMSQGTCHLATCPACRVRYLKSRVTLRVQSGIFSQGECPNCKFAKGRKAAARTGSGQRRQAQAEQLSP